MTVKTVIGTRPKIKLGKRIIMRNTAFYSIRKWEKTFANHTFDKEIISNIYIRNSCNSIVKNQVTQFKNGQRT